MTPPPAQGSGRAGDAIVAPLQPPADVHLDDTSDNIINQLARTFWNDMNGKLGILYRKWRTHPSRNLALNLVPSYGEGDEETHLLDELRGFGFGYIYGAGARAVNLGTAAKAGSDGEAKAKQDLAAAWKGKAADSATEKLDDLGKALGEYTTAVNGFGQLLRSLWDTVRPPILYLANTPYNGGSTQVFMSAHDPGDCDGLSSFVDNLGKAIQFGRSTDVFSGRNGFAPSQGSGTGPIDPQDIRHMSVDLDGGFDSKWSDQFCDQMDKYAKGYSDAMAEFRQNVRDAHTAAENALRAFVDGLNVPTDPFGTLALGPGGPPPGTSSGGHDTGGTPSTSGGGHTTSQSVPQQPPIPQQPPVPEQPAVPATPATSQPDPNTNLVTHQPLAIDPQTGQPYPIDPRTGQPVTDEPEMVTVQQGDHKIAMTEPGADGTMDIKVDDGSGQAKDYALDFGDGTAAGQPAGPDGAGYPAGSGVPGAAGDPAGSGVPGAGYPAGSGVPGAAGFPAGTGIPGDAAHPVGTDGAAHLTDPGHGPSGHDAGATQDPSTAYHPGPDGKIHITDGALQITAERPDGPAGPTVVTVDDGTGHPTTYTLGSEHADAQGVPVAQAQGDVGLPPAAPDHAVAQPAVAGPPVQAEVGAMPNPASPLTPADLPGHAMPDAVPDQPLAQSDFSGSTSPAAAQFDAASPMGDAGAGSDGSTAPQSAFDPFDSHSSLPGHGNDSTLGQTVDPTGMHSGDAGHPAPDNPLGTAPDGAPQQQQQSGSMGMMGGGMMGGLMGGSGGDQERSSGAYRIEGSLFKNQNEGSNRISGSLDDEPPTP